MRPCLLHRTCFGIALAFCVAAGSPPLTAQPSSPYEVTWNTPSPDFNGTMPLGNGEVALNAWIEPSGDLRFYIARTDSWDDTGRLLKVGSVRVRIGQPSPTRTATFRQTLTVKDATLRATFGEGNAQVSLHLWVDANRPVVYVEATTPVPTEATASIELWRTTQQSIDQAECSDIFRNRPEKTLIEPDTLFAGLPDRVGWYHRNIKSVGPELCAKIQGLADFPRPDPLLHRTFGALIATDRPQRLDDHTLKSTAATTHLFQIAVHARHPATAEQWLTETQAILDQTRAIPLADRRAAHDTWWADFWNRSWINITSNGRPVILPSASADAPAPSRNNHPVRIGMDQNGGSRFSGEFGRVSIYDTPLPDADIQKLASLGPQQTTDPSPSRLYSAIPTAPQTLPDLAAKTFDQGLTLEAWIKPASLRTGARIIDKITPGGSDGFLLDTHPGSGLRLIFGRQTRSYSNILSASQWHHVAASIHPGGSLALFLDGKPLSAAGNATAAVSDGDDAFIVSRAYALQRYISACAGRGRYPIKYNGSLFTVPAPPAPGDADYRRWGPGYWWQNTRLPYYSMCASGDFDLMQPLFQMYGRDLVPLLKFRTRRYLNHDGIFIPECIYFWGDIFTETYGWKPFEERTDKLQTSGWHKWEWVSGLELAGLMLDYCDYTQDQAFLKDTALPFAREVLTFFDQQYKPGDDGKLYMHPAQACETWWDCVNPMPELAGLHAITARLLDLPPAQTGDDLRAFCRQLQSKLPAIPTTHSPDGRTMLAPAQVFKLKRNIENPELYAVFPFRLFAIDKPNLDWAIEALDHRLDRGPQGWRQEDIFMAYLGLPDQARQYVVHRASTKHAASRFPAFWGPNYDWVPDQDHGSVLLKAVQSLLMQTDGRTIYLLPAWPADWNADFRLHAPYNTVVSARVENGTITRLDVQPPERAGDVKIWTQTEGKR